MGRKKLNLRTTVVRLSDAMLARIDAHVGTYGRSEFIRSAVERELLRREKKSPERLKKTVDE